MARNLHCWDADRSIRGFTLIEVAFVLVLVTVLVVIGWGSIQGLMPRFRMVQVAKELRNDVYALRFTAIEQRRETRLRLVSADPDWRDPDAPSRGAWLLQVGDRPLGSRRWDTLPVEGEPGAVDAHTGAGTVDLSTEAPGVSLAPWGALQGPGVGNADAIVFGPGGHVLNPASDFGPDGTIDLKLVNKAAWRKGYEDSITLRITRAGMVRMVSSLGGDDLEGAAGTGLVSREGS